MLDEWEWDYTRYLDKEFLKAYSIVECRQVINVKSILCAFLMFNYDSLLQVRG